MKSARVVFGLRKVDTCMVIVFAESSFDDWIGLGGATPHEETLMPDQATNRTNAVNLQKRIN